MAVRAQQSYLRPVAKPIAEGATVPNPGMVDAMVLSTITGGLLRWTGVAWTSVRAWPRAVTAELDFGHPGGGQAYDAVTAVAAPWVRAGQPITCMPAGVDSADHGPRDAALEELDVYAGNVVTGVGFDIYGTAPNGTFGRHLITATG